MKTRLITLFLVCCMTQGMVAQLTSLGLVEESSITTVNKNGYMHFIPELAFVDDYLYVATPNGLYRYLYKSQSGWEKLPLTDELVLDFKVHGDTLIALTRDRLLYSLDGGKTARTDSVARTDDSYLLGMAVHPRNAAHILVATYKAGLWQTYNGGAEWTEITKSDGKRMSLTEIFFNPHDATKLVGAYNNTTLDYSSLLFSCDGGTQWESGKGEYSNSNLSQVLNVAFHPTIESRAVVCGDNIYAISDNTGSSWTGIFKSNGDCEVRITDVLYDTRNPDILYGANMTVPQDKAISVLYSTDGGYTWGEFFNESVPDGRVLSFDMKDNLLALYTYAGGIYLLNVDAVDTSVAPVVNEEGTSPYYDLMGRKVDCPTRGIYIREGRKVVIK